MTTLTDIFDGNDQSPEPAKQKPAKPVAAAYRVNPWIGAILDGGLASWLGGIALHKGFGVSVPFVAGWVLVTFALLLVFSVASMAAGAWHREAVKAATHLTVAEVVAERETERVLDAQDLLDLHAKLRGE